MPNPGAVGAPIASVFHLVAEGRRAADQRRVGEQTVKYEKNR
jgi:hypothetical protein